MKKVITLILLCILGLLIGFIIGNRNKIFEPRKKELKIYYDTTRDIEIEKEDGIDVSTEYKSNKELSISVSNIKNQSVRIKCYIINKSSRDKAHISIKAKANDDIYEIKVNPNDFDIDQSSSKQIEIEIILKDTSKMESNKLDLSLSINATAI